MDPVVGGWTGAPAQGWWTGLDQEGGTVQSPGAEKKAKPKVVT